MRLDIFRYGVVSCVVGLAACATAPPTSTPKLAEPVGPGAGSTAPVVAAVLVPRSVAVAPASASAPLINPKYVAKGYRVRQRGKYVLYCRSEVPTASNIRSDTCRTEEQLEREAATTRAVIESMQQPRDSRSPSASRRN